MKTWVLILSMGIVTYLPRLLPMLLADKLVLPLWLKNALAFVPIAVLTAIVTQAAFVRDGTLDLSLSNFHALSAGVAFVVALLTRHMFLTIGAGLLCFVILKIINMM